MMKKDSFYQFIAKEINKNSYNRMNLPTFTRVLRKKAQEVSSVQLLFIYKELQRLKSKNSQFHLSGQKIIEQNRPFNPKAGMKMQSYEKHTLICLQEIAIKLKQKNGYEEGFDLCKLLYYRLLNAIEFNLPHAHILEQFSQQFLWKDFGEDIIDYVGLIEKDPSTLSPLYIETVNHIIQTIFQELEIIDILQLPHLKSVLSKGQSYSTYYIDQLLIQKIDKLIDQNKYAYSFRELESSLISDIKHQETHILFSLMSKDLAEKRLNFMFIDENNYLGYNSRIQAIDEIKSQLGLPGKNIDEDYFDFAFTKISQLNLFGVYVDLFQKTHQQREIIKTQLARNYIKYNFQYLLKSGNVNCPSQKITEVLNNSFETKQKMQQKGLKFQHMQILKLFIVCQMLSRKQINAQQLRESHLCLQKSLQKLNLVHNPKYEELRNIFQNSLLDYNFIEVNCKNNAQKTLYQFIQTVDSKILNDLISEELSYLTNLEKNFVMNELILSLINSLLDKNSPKNASVRGKILDIFMKLQFKKFSTQFSNVQKLLNLIHQKSDFLNKQKQNKTVQEKQISKENESSKLLSY